MGARVYVRMFTHTSMCECAHASMCECVHASMCECAHASMCECVHVSMCECVHVVASVFCLLCHKKVFCVRVWCGVSDREIDEMKTYSSLHL